MHTFSRIPFRRIELADAKSLSKRVACSRYDICQFSFANLFCLQEKYQTGIYCDDGGVIIRYAGRDEEGYRAYLMPLTDEGSMREHHLTHLLQRIQDDAASLDAHVLLWGVTEAMLTQLDALKLGYYAQPDRDWWDYLYLSDKLRTLRGRSLQKRRHWAHRFMSDYEGRYRVTPISQKDIARLRVFQEKWIERRRILPNFDPALNDEHASMQSAFDHFFELGLEGILVEIDGQVASFLYGQAINDRAFDIIVQKSIPEAKGITQFIFSTFAESIKDRALYVNFEEDTGNEGLRAAKLGYRPDVFLKKSKVYLSSL